MMIRIQLSLKNKKQRSFSRSSKLIQDRTGTRNLKPNLNLFPKSRRQSRTRSPRLLDPSGRIFKRKASSLMCLRKLLEEIKIQRIIKTHSRLMRMKKILRYTKCMKKCSSSLRIAQIPHSRTKQRDSLQKRENKSPTYLMKVSMMRGMKISKSKRRTRNLS